MVPTGRLPGCALVLLSFLSALILNTAYAQQPTDRSINYDSFDARSRSAQTSAFHEAQSGRAYASGAVQRSGSSFPRSLFDLSGPITGPRSGDAETIARDYLRREITAFQTKGASPFNLPLVARYESAHAGLTHLTFQPSYAGVAYFDSEVQVHVGRDGEIWRVNQKPIAPAPATLSLTLGPRTAVEAALREIAPEVHPQLRVVDPENGPDRRAVFSGPDLAGPVRVKQVWFPLPSVSLPAWQVYLPVAPLRTYAVVVDDDSGKILFSLNLAHQVNPQGKVFPAGTRPHPDAGPQTSEPFTGWPSTSGICPADVYPSQFQSGPAAGGCWVEATETKGPNVDACLDADGNNVCDGRATDAQAHFDFDFTDGYAQSGNAVTDRNAAIANAFYWANTLHDWLYRLGFDEPAGNFQADNYSRGGAAGDALWIDVQDAAAQNNAFFTTPPDGIAPRMDLGLFAGLRRDSAFDADIIIHEYVHGLTTRLVGGPNSVIGLFRWHSGAMGEGWSDAYAASFTDDPVVGEYVTGNSTTGIRGVAYDNSPYTFGQFGTLRPKAIPNTGLILNLPQVHSDGEIWATVLWDVRQAIGQSNFEQVATTALKLTPSRPSMLDARDAILQAAQSSGVDGPNGCTIWTAFAARGFGYSALLNPIEAGQPNDTALSVYEAYDAPAICGGSPPLAVDQRFNDDVESGTNGWTASGLWHRTTRRAASGQYSWWFGQESTGTYNTGARVSGSLTSPVIDLSGVTGAAVEWDQVLLTEGFGNAIDLGGGAAGAYLNADSGRLLISADSGATWKTLTHLAHNTTTGVFTAYRISLSRFSGSSVLLRFAFDTIDNQFNNFEGWFIDNVRVSRLSAQQSQLIVAPQTLGFVALAGGSTPPSQTLSVTEGQGGSLGWTTTVTQGASWLSASPASGMAPSTMTVSVSPAGLPAGAYSGAVTVSAPGALDSPATVNVTLTVTAAPTPAASWSFEETGAGPGVAIVDSAGGAHNGTTYGPGTVATTGVSGLSRLLNGATDYVEVPPSAALTPQQFTVRAWVRLLSYPEKFGVLLSAFGGSNYQGWYLAVKSSGEVILLGATPPSSAPWLVSNAKLALGRWHAIAVTVDRTSGDAAIYIDGIRDVEAQFPGIDADTTQPLTFGRASWYDGYYLNAQIDEATIDPRLQSAAEIAADYQSFSPPAPPTTTSTVAEWDFESGAQDVSGNGHHGTTTGTQIITAVSGQGRRFNGATDSISVPGSTDLTPTSFTLRTWVKLISYPTDWGAVVANYGGAADGWFVGINSSGRVLCTMGSLPDSALSVISNTSVSLNRWQHLTVTYDGARRWVRFYLDGVAVGQGYVPGLTPQTSGVLSMGKASWANDFYLNMDLDEVLLVPASWTSTEVQSDFAAFQVDLGLQPVAEWRLDETASGPGTVLADSSGNGHDAVTAGLGTDPIPAVSANGRSFTGRPDYAYMNPAPDLSTSSFSFTTWVKLDAHPGNWGVIYSTYGGDYQGWYVGVYNDGRVILSVSGLPTHNPWLLSAGSLLAGHWHHLAVTFDGGTRRGLIYIDGKLDRGATFPAFTPQTAASPTFGRASWYDGYYLECKLDEARLYPGDLSAEEITTQISSFPPPPLPDLPDPVAFWKFDDLGTGPGLILADSSGGGHDAVTEGLGTTSVAGVAGSARSFDGYPDYAHITPHADLSTAGFSFSTWVKLDALPSNWGVLFANYGGDFQGWYVGVFNDGRVILSVSGLPSSNPWLLSAGSLTAGNWHHVAVTFDGPSRRGLIYIDGVRDRSAVFPVFTPQTAIQPTFGRASWYDGYYLRSILDHARLYPVELTAYQVAADMQSAP